VTVPRRRQSSSSQHMPRSSSIRDPRTGFAALTAEAEALRNASEGSRNDQLNRAAFSIGQLVGGHELDVEYATDVLAEAALDCRLDPTEIDGTLPRAMADGAQQPRTTKDPLVLRAEAKWPELPPAALHGIAGEIVRAIQPHSESDPAALLLTVLATAGAILGRGPHMLANSAEHPARLFVVLAGDTAKARKGTSWNNVERVFRVAAPEFMEERVMNGFGSGESIVDAVADSQLSHQLLIQEPEFARQLTVASRESSILSMIIRVAWDGAKLQTRSRQQTVVASDAHIAMVAHVTIEELQKKLSDVEVANGFANRFLFACVKRSNLLPHGGNLTDDMVERLGLKLRDRLRAAHAIRRMTWSDAARRRWEQLYRRMADDTPTGLLGAVTARAEPQVLRLAVTYAALDGSHEVDLEHVEAAWAVWQYCRASAEYIFRDGNEQAIERKLRTALESAGEEGLSMEEQHRALGNNISAPELEAARRRLESRGVIETRKEDKTGPGRKRHVSRLIKPKELLDKPRSQRPGAPPP
jgi:hypothetical protein